MFGKKSKECVIEEFLCNFPGGSGGKVTFD